MARGVSPSSSALARLATMQTAAPSFRPEALPAVTVPSLAKGGLQAGQVAHGQAHAHVLVGVENLGVALALGHRDGHDLTQRTCRR